MSGRTLEKWVYILTAIVWLIAVLFPSRTLLNVAVLTAICAGALTVIRGGMSYAHR